ncbi:hypothetical protein N7495_006385 [Penicillium taxi]|uniref:uncharacterized protein n=1 Tax=Penicillium taxi TaxID=168475 RepID=UPI0025455E67|nr:uncharacterized protein N7495_006385 [Penicillium taxi]KAJ5894694.1 hypothetical protein N7495_006385 [Penicillium taxi]
MDPKIFLAENVLNERQTITYRSLSRALKVHANRAKQILFEFHRNENAKTPQTVHATYVISGIQEQSTINGNGNANKDDEVPPSSPYLPSSMPNQDSSSESVRISSIILAREEDLEDAKATFQSISKIHIYSIQSTVIQDLNTLTDAAEETAKVHAQEDPLECGKQWGMIQNHNVKRRTGTRPPPPPEVPVPKKSEPIAKKPESTVPAKRPLQKESVKSDIKAEEPKSQPSASGTQSSVNTSTKTVPPKQKGNLFSSFAKAKPKSKPTAPLEDVVMDDASEEEQEELFPDSADKDKDQASRESKREREDKLRKMMEDDEADDEEMPDADEEPEREPTPMEQLPPPKPVELKEEISVQGGRRRGRRQVMKKRTVKDEEGYLVTREEPSWESFSEDEPAPVKKKPAVNVPKAKGGKPGQGNIMSFFGKK